jgi:hypothetical protein
MGLPSATLAAMLSLNITTSWLTIANWLRREARRQSLKLMAVERDLARRGTHETRQQVDQGGLACARGAHQRHDLARLPHAG